WLFERFEFPFVVVFPAALDTGKLASRYDVLVFPTGAIPAADSERTGPGGGAGGGGVGGGGGGGGDVFFATQPDPERIPAEFRSWLGRVTAAKTVPQLRQFLEDGGTVLAIGTSASVARH